MKIFVASVSTPANYGSISGHGEGIYCLEWDEGSMLRRTGVLKADNASMITTRGDGFLYSVNETRDFGGMNGSGGGVTACHIEKDGTLSLVNSSLSYGSRPAYVTVYGDYVLVANHGSHSTVTCHYEMNEDGSYGLRRGFDDSSVALFARRKDGGTGELKDLKVFQGHGYWCHGGGQSTSHIHCVQVKDGLVAACNRGADRIEVMRLEKDHLSLLGVWQSEAGYAPRHGVFHPTLDLFYAVNENYPSLSAYSFDRVTGEGRVVSTECTMDEAYEKRHPLPHFNKREADILEENNSAMGNRSLAMPADIHITSDGLFLYTSNRYRHGASIAVFAVCKDGSLRKAQVKTMRGTDIRGFQLTEDNRYIVVAVLDESRVDIFKIDEQTGEVGERVASCEVPSPSSVAIVQ